MVVAVAAVGYAAGKYAMWKQPVGTDANWCIALPPDGSARDFLAANHPDIAAVIDWRGWSVYPGKYCEQGQQPAHAVARRIATGQREEISVPVPSKRSVAEIAQALAPRIWADSASLAAALGTDSMRWQIPPIRTACTGKHLPKNWPVGCAPKAKPGGMQTDSRNPGRWGCRSVKW